MTSYAVWLEALLPGPLAGRWGRGLARTIGESLDEVLPLAKAAAKAGLLADAPDDALAFHGEGRALPRGPGEDLDAYRARLIAAWQVWRWATTARSLRDALVLAELGGATIYPQRELPLLPRRAAWWSRFAVVFPGRAVYDAGATWDGPGVAWEGRLPAGIEALPAAEARATLRAVIRPWKAARDRVTAAIVARGSRLWDTGNAWDQPFAWDEGDGVTRLGSETWDGTAKWDDPSAGVYDYLL